MTVPARLRRLAMGFQPALDPNFTATRWSVVLAMHDVTCADGSAALAWLCNRYWYPLFSYIRGRGHTREDAEDLVQAFFERMLSDAVLRRAHPERGRFRSFLLGCLNHFLAHEWTKSKRVRRGGRVAFLSFDHDAAEEWLQQLVISSNPAGDYDRAWALALIDRVLDRLREETDPGGDTDRFAVLQRFLHGSGDELTLAQGAELLGLSLAAVKSLVHRFRKRFRELVRAEVRETVASPLELDDEMKHIFAALSR